MARRIIGPLCIALGGALLGIVLLVPLAQGETVSAAPIPCTPEGYIDRLGNQLCAPAEAQTTTNTTGGAPSAGQVTGGTTGGAPSAGQVTAPILPTTGVAHRSGPELAQALGIALALLLVASGFVLIRRGRVMRAQA